MPNDARLRHRVPRCRLQLRNATPAAPIATEKIGAPAFSNSPPERMTAPRKWIPVPHVHIITIAAASNIPQSTSAGASSGLFQVTLRAVSWPTRRIS